MIAALCLCFGGLLGCCFGIVILAREVHGLTRTILVARKIVAQEVAEAIVGQEIDQPRSDPILG